MDLGAAQLEARRRREECRAAEAAGNRFTRRLNERNVVPSARERTEERRRMEGIVSVPNDASYKPLEDSITTRSRDLKANDQYPQTQQLANEFLSDLSIDGVGFNYYQTQASCSRDFGFRDPTHESTFISSSRANFSEPNTNLQLGYTLTPSYTTPQSLPPAPASSQDTFPSEIVDPVTGRPRLGDLLKDYNTHVAKEIWDKPMTAWVRKVHRRDKALQKLMQIFHGTPRNVEWRKMVEASGVFGLFWRQLRHVDHTLIYAFVERWHPETNTFHLPFGEMTITLHDVLHISSLPIDGEAVSGFLTDLGIRKHATYLFGPWTDEEFHQILNDNGFKTAHLWDCMISFIHHDGSPQAIVSAWLLQFLAVTLFMDKSTHKIKAKFLCLIVDYARTGRLAWGTGSLAYLYRQLGKASRRDTTKIAGFIALLSRWISHYFPSFRTYKEDHTPLISQVRLREYREQIEHLRASDVIWFPYEKQIRSWNGPERISMYRGTIQCMNIVEPYHPDRVARQFGRVQDIPLDPIQPIRGVRPFTSKQYNLEFNDVEDRWERRHSDEAIRSTLRSASLTIVLDIQTVRQQITMVAFSRLVAGLSAVTASLAAPAEVVERSVEERGPHNFFLGPDHPLARRTAINYNQDYTTGGTVNFSPSKTGFNLNWNTQQDFVVGVGWQPGTNLPINYSGTFNVSSGLGSLSVYGWTTNPLVEYYVMETNIGISTGGSQKGTLTSDGGTYAIWENQRVNEPSIIGTATFNQYISIRQSARSSGTVTIQNHFDAWAKAGLNLGTMNFQVIAVESWSGSGSASQQVSNGGTGTGTPTSSSGSTGPTGPSGSCSALYGQCGGIGWNGPTCCSSGSCKVSNSYYSQCL